MNPSQQNPGEEWERFLDRELKRLPDRPAPATLVARVLAAIEARARLPWYQRAWSTWPRLAQGLSLALLSFLLGALTYACLHFPELASADTVSARLDTWLAPWVALWNAGQAVAGVLVTMCHKAGGWLCAGLAAVGLAGYLSAVGAGTVLYRLAFTKQEVER